VLLGGVIRNVQFRKEREWVEVVGRPVFELARAGYAYRYNSHHKKPKKKRKEKRI
jgi:hypothetical protein